MQGNRREKIYEMYQELKAFSQFATMWSPIENWLHEQALQKGTPAPKSNEPDANRPGAPVGATFRWMEMTGRNDALSLRVPAWFLRELGTGTVHDYFGPRQIKLRSRRLKQIAEAARAQAEEEKRELMGLSTNP